MSLAKRVFELQQIELAIHTRNKQLEDINIRLNHNEAFERAEAELHAAEESRKESEKQYSELDWEAEELRGNIKQIDAKLYGGKVKNPKELMGFEQEANMLKANLAKKDDVLLELMEKIEAAKVTIKKLHEVYKTEERSWNKEKIELQGQADKIEEELAELEKKKQDILNNIDRTALAAYESIRDRKGLSVVKVEQGRCMGCRVTLSLSELQRVRGIAIVTCSNCGRILYLS